jgi:hypothetical protein
MNSAADETERLKQQLRLLAIAIQRATDRADLQQKILEQHEARLALLEAQAQGVSTQN